MKYLAVAVLAALSTPVAGQQACSMSNAIYTQPESGYELHFRPVDTDVMTSMSTSNMFSVVQPGKDERLFGEVIGNNGVSRPTGVASLICDGSESESANCQYCVETGCVYWQGVVYALGDSSADLLPAESEAAPQTILLSDFGRQMRYADPDFNFTYDPPWDVFSLEGCGQ